MNNLQHIVKDNTRFAMHMAVELCEQGDFDSVPEAFRWLNQETVGNYTRWHELFGTPERAARTICRQLKHFNICICDGCPVKPPNKECDSEYDALLEWLRGEGDTE